MKKTKIVLRLLLGTVCILFFSLNVMATETEDADFDFLPGDLNYDGIVNTTDVVILRRYIAGGYGIDLTPPHLRCDHAEVVDAAVSPTCSEPGLTEGKHCSACGEVLIKQEIVPAKGHTEVIDAAKEASCSKTGLTEGKHCSSCDKVLIAQEIIPILEHRYVNGVCLFCNVGSPTPDRYFEFTLKQDGTYSLEPWDPSEIPENVVIPSAYQGIPVTEIGVSAFNNQFSVNPIPKSIVIPTGVICIRATAFFHCSMLRKVVLPEGLTSIGYQAFWNCGLSDITIPDSVTTIDGYAFSSCDGLSKVILPAGLKTISNGVFNRCTNLTMVDIQEGVTEIGDAAFAQCSNLTSITIPASLECVKDSAFDGCPQLKYIYYAGTEQDWNSISSYAGNDALFQATVYYYSESQPVGEGNYWHYADGIPVVWGETGTPEEYFEFTRTADGNYSIKLKKAGFSLEKIAIPEYHQGVKIAHIAEDAFFDCVNLVSVEIPEGVTTIGNRAFCGCVNLSCVAIPGGVTSIGRYAFSDCASLTDIAVPNGVTAIEEGTFLRCTNLARVTLPDCLEVVGDCAFQECSSLISLEIPDGVTSIGRQVVYTCTNLKSLTIPSTVISFDSVWAIANCTNLSDIIFGGTTDQWYILRQKINFDDTWNYNTGSYIIYCSDGVLTKD